MRSSKKWRLSRVGDSAAWEKLVKSTGKHLVLVCLYILIVIQLLFCTSLPMAVWLGVVLLLLGVYLTLGCISSPDDKIQIRESQALIYKKYNKRNKKPYYEIILPFKCVTDNISEWEDEQRTVVSTDNVTYIEAAEYVDNIMLPDAYYFIYRQKDSEIWYFVAEGYLRKLGKRYARTFFVDDTLSSGKCLLNVLDRYDVQLIYADSYRFNEVSTVPLLLGRDRPEDTLLVKEKDKYTLYGLYTSCQRHSYPLCKNILNSDMGIYFFDGDDFVMLRMPLHEKDDFYTEVYRKKLR